MASEDLSKLKIEKSVAAVRPLKRRKRYGFWIFVVLLIAAAVVLYDKGVFKPAVSVEVVSVVQMYPSQSFTLLNASGYVVAQRKAAVASKVTGRLVSIAVEEGSRVKAGQVIARLESDDVAAGRNQAEASLKVTRHNLDQAKAEVQDASLVYQRNRELLAKGFVARSEYDASEARYRKAEAALAAAQASISVAEAALQSASVSVEYTLIRAPFDAVVLTKNADIGDIVTPIGAAAEAKAAVVNIADMDSLQVEVDVSESSLAQVKVGQPCEIQLDAIAESRFNGVVHMVVPTADRTKATVMVKVRFIEKDDRILPEMSAKVAFLAKAVNTDEKTLRTVINPAAIITKSNSKAVFLVKDNLAEEVLLTTGQQLGDMVEVLSGVKAGDRVILRPLDKISNGAKIKVVEK